MASYFSVPNDTDHQIPSLTLTNPLNKFNTQWFCNDQSFECNVINQNIFI